MIEDSYDVSFVAGLAAREKQIQQNYRPIIAVHKWFARRSGTLFRSLVLSEFIDTPVSQTYYEPHRLVGHTVGDPFMGGGTPLVEANRVGCDVVGSDINPMAYWIVRQELEHLDIERYKATADALRQSVSMTLGHLYHTTCTRCGRPDAVAKYFLWVKTRLCSGCGRLVRLFPHHLIASNQRHPLYVLVCSNCGALNETASKDSPGGCAECGRALALQGIVRDGVFRCPYCSLVGKVTHDRTEPPNHQMFAIEFYCPSCTGHIRGRLFKKPDTRDLETYEEASGMLSATDCRYIPADAIPDGDETRRLHRWGYRYYRELFNARQLVGLEFSARSIMDVPEQRIRNALATNLSDLVRYQNMLCRYDTMALKSLDVFSVHGFPAGLIQCESNMIGIADPRRQVLIGSGGWANIIDKYWKARLYCDAPFEIQHDGPFKRIVPIVGEWIGDRQNGGSGHTTRRMSIQCADATRLAWQDESMDAVFTDPPYLGNVQYAELMDFCYVWLRKLLVKDVPEFAPATTRVFGELTANATMSRGIDHFTQGLSESFQRVSRALKRGSPLVFTYHHNLLDAYLPVAVALLDARLTCTTCLPCPAEMTGSIHINRTKSAVVDSVFVCRARGKVSRRLLPSESEGIAALVQEDVQQLEQAGLIVRPGDVRCIAFGHLTRLAVWSLRSDWEKNRAVDCKLAIVREAIESLGAIDALLDLIRLGKDAGRAEHGLGVSVHEKLARYVTNEQVSF